MISKTHQNNENLIVDGNNIKLDKYPYLGTMINSHNDYTNEIKIRIENGRANFAKMRSVLWKLFELEFVFH